MISTGAKYFFAIAAFALLAAFVYGLSTYGDPVGMSALTGVLSLGYKGGVGEHAGYSVLVGLAGAALFLGGVASATRDADPKALAEIVVGPDAPAEAAPEVSAPVGFNWWPVVLTFGIAVVVLGMVTRPLVFVLGWVVVGLAALEWGVRAWADHATGDNAVNRTLRNRFLNPLELPVYAAIGVGFFVISLSRLLLSTDEHIATALFGAAALIVLVVAALLNARPSSAKALIRVCLAIGAVVILAAGIVGLSRGEHHPEHDIHGKHFRPHTVAQAPVGVQGPIVVEDRS
ncbi:MAG: hypothetical protein ABI276_04775 [Acidimicrobiales bacterium]